MKAVYNWSLVYYRETGFVLCCKDRKLETPRTLHWATSEQSNTLDIKASENLCDGLVQDLEL